MGRARSHDLFDLIKSLDSNEKRHFKLLSKLQNEGGKEKKYIALFNAIDKMKEWDEKKFRDKVKHKIKPSNIPVHKNLLYHLILKSLRSYNEKNNSNISRQLYNKLEESEILENKGLYNQSERLLDEIKVKAVKAELYLIVLEVLQRKARFILSFRVKEIKKILEQWALEMKESLTLVEMEFRYTRLHYLTFLEMRLAKNNQDTEALNRFITQLKNDPLFTHPPQKDATIMSQVLYYNLKANAEHYSQNKEEANKWYANAVQLIENYLSSTIDRKFVTIYKVVLGNYLQNCHSIGKYDVFEEGISKIKNIQSSNFDEEAEDFQSTISLELLYYMNTGQFEKISKLKIEIDHGFNKYKNKINFARKISIYYNLLIAFFVSHKFEEALEWAERILYKEEGDPRQDIKNATKIIELILNYELNNDRFFDHIVSKINYRKRRSLKNEHVLLRPIISHIKKLFNRSDRKSKLFLELNKTLSQIKSEYSVTLPPIEEVVLWCDSHIKNVTMKDLIEQQKTQS